MSITTYEGPMFGTPEWWAYWKRQPKDEIIRFYEVAVNTYKEKDEEVSKLRGALNKEHIAWQCADCKSDGLEIEKEKLQKIVNWLAQDIAEREKEAWEGFCDPPTEQFEPWFWVDAARKASQNEA